MNKEQEQNADKIFKVLQNCIRNRNKPDLHSFFINIDGGGRSYVEGQLRGIYMETYIGEKKTCWAGTAVAAANRLALLNADLSTLDM